MQPMVANVIVLRQIQPLIDSESTENSHDDVLSVLWIYF